VRQHGKGPAEIAAALSISRMSVWRAVNGTQWTRHSDRKWPRDVAGCAGQPGVGEAV